jgi:hypothetical protein
MKMIAFRRARPTPEVSLDTMTFSIHATAATPERLVSTFRLSPLRPTALLEFPGTSIRALTRRA